LEEEEPQEDVKNGLPAWFWPLIGTTVAALILIGVILLAYCLKKQSPPAEDKAEEESNYQDKSCCTKLADCFRKKQSPSPPGSIVEDTPAKNAMVDEES